MRSAVLLVLLTLVACGGRTRVAVRTPAHTVGDRVEMTFECTQMKRIARCEPRDPWCRTAVKEVAVPCPRHTLTMRGDGGVVVETALPADGRVSADIPPPGAPPQHWQVDADGLPIGTVDQRSYGWLTATLDGLVVASIVAGSVIVAQDDPDDGTDYGAHLLLGAAVLYAVGTPITHAAHGNGGEAARSVARRLAIPAVFAVATAVNECPSFETDPWECKIAPVIAGIVTTVFTAPIFMIWDYKRAVLPTGLRLVSPTISADRDRAVLGLAGQF